MKKTIYLITFLVMVFSWGSSFAIQNNIDANKDSTQALGIHFGNVSGNGLSYRRWINNFGFQAVLGGYNTGTNTYNFPDSVAGTTLLITRNDMGRKYSLNLGLNAIYSLKKTKLFTFYLTGGFCWKYYTRKNFKQNYKVGETNPAYLFQDGNVYSTHSIQNYLNMGAGPGVEVKIGPYFKLALEIPVTYTGKHEFIMYVPQIGLYYYFK